VNGAPTQNAYDAINEVRRRGYGLPLDQPDANADLPSSLSYTDFKQQIQDERARELCFEGLRRSDLIRWGIFKQVMEAMVTEIQASNASVTNKNRWILGYNTAASSPRYTILPIPALELNINKAIRQNQGW
jgi:starch-binding outer membrane protein, SusD/RagB family